MSTKALRWNDFEIVKSLGEGQAGVVQLCRLRRSFLEYNAGDYLAIKRYKRWVLEQPGQLERIIRELETRRRIQHPNLVHSLAALVDDEGKPALVMRYYEGETLQQYLEKLRSSKEYMSFEKAMLIIGELASALDSLHSAGILHRDIKPANVILSGNSPILMDLGVVKSSDFPEQTTSGTFLGTIRYSAPEYLFGQSETPLLDIYSLGAIAYELLIGEEYLKEEMQWARLIVRKSNPEVPVINYYELSARIGLNRAEFSRFILESSLSEVKERNLDLETLTRAINDQVWNKRFHASNGQVFPNPDPLDFPLADTDHDGVVTPEDIAKYFRSELSNYDLHLLQEFLAKYYWYKSDRYRDGGNFWVLQQTLNDVKRLEETKAVEIDADTHGIYCRLVDAVRVIFRYGLI